MVGPSRPRDSPRGSGSSGECAARPGRADSSGSRCFWRGVVRPQPAAPTCCVLLGQLHPDREGLGAAAPGGPGRFGLSPALCRTEVGWGPRPASRPGTAFAVRGDDGAGEVVVQQRGRVRASPGQCQVAVPVPRHCCLRPLPPLCAQRRSSVSGTAERAFRATPPRSAGKGGQHPRSSGGGSAGPAASPWGRCSSRCSQAASGGTRRGAARGRPSTEHAGPGAVFRHVEGF